MTLKILWQDIFPEVHPLYPDIDVIYDALARAARTVVRGDTEVILSHVDRYCSVESPCVELVNRPQMLEKIVAAASSGYDAAMIGCFYDPALREARSAVTIPVTGPAESAMLMAQMLGSKFAVVADWQTDVPLIEEQIRLYGFEGRAIRHRPVRSAGRNDDTFAVMIECLKTNDPGRMIAGFESVARECVAEGADTVIMGCAYTSAVFDLYGYREVGNSGVPVVSASFSALKMAEMLADAHRNSGLKRTTSTNSIYVTARREVVSETFAAFGR